MLWVIIGNKWLFREEEGVGVNIADSTVLKCNIGDEADFKHVHSIWGVLIRSVWL